MPSGLEPKDIDVVQIYDAINTVLALEDLGFCAKGEGARSSRMARLRWAAGCLSIPMEARWSDYGLSDL